MTLADSSSTAFPMTRRARVHLPEVPLHIIPRGNSRQACFHADEDYGFYVDCLQQCASKTRCQVHPYVLRTNHVHLLATGVHVQRGNRGQTTVCWSAEVWSEGKRGPDIEQGSGSFWSVEPSNKKSLWVLGSRGLRHHSCGSAETAVCSRFLLRLLLLMGELVVASSLAVLDVGEGHE